MFQNLLKRLKGRPEPEDFGLVRLKYLQSKLDREKPGLEIGPSYRPIARKDEGYQVDIIDHMSAEGLREKYDGRPGIDVSYIEEVDFVWSGEPYLELTGKPHHYHWILASHVIEHTTDFVGFLLECDAILHEEGTLVLAVPDKRFCFDLLRQVTGLGQVIDRHLTSADHHTPGDVADAILHSVNQEASISWDPGQKGHIGLNRSAIYVRDQMEEVMQNQTFIDVHAWCFTPSSFHLLILDLHDMGMLPFYVEELSRSEKAEFYCILGKDKSKSIKTTRLELMKAVQQELREMQI